MWFYDIERPGSYIISLLFIDNFIGGPSYTWRDLNPNLKVNASEQDLSVFAEVGRSTRCWQENNINFTKDGLKPMV